VEHWLQTYWDANNKNHEEDDLCPILSLAHHVGKKPYKAEHYTSAE
jgi:hypothetical protein